MTDTSLSNISPEVVLAFFLKIMFMLGAVIYVVFAGLVIRQISLMSRTVQTPSTGLIKILGYIHFLISLIIFIFYLLFL